MVSMEPVYNLSPMCNLSEDELEVVNTSNAEFAIWDPYKDKKRADEAERQLEIYKERTLLAEAKVEELLNIIKLSRNELIKNNVKGSLEAKETVLPEEKPNRWLSCLSNVKIGLKSCLFDSLTGKMLPPQRSKHYYLSTCKSAFKIDR